MIFSWSKCSRLLFEVIVWSLITCPISSHLKLPESKNLFGYGDTMHVNIQVGTCARTQENNYKSGLDMSISWLVLNLDSTKQGWKKNRDTLTFCGLFLSAILWKDCCPFLCHLVFIAIYVKTEVHGGVA